MDIIGPSQRRFEKEQMYSAKRKVLFHLENARLHTRVDATAKFNELSCELLYHPPYSADLVWCSKEIMLKKNLYFIQKVTNLLALTRLHSFLKSRGAVTQVDRMKFVYPKVPNSSRSGSKF